MSQQTNDLQDAFKVTQEKEPEILNMTINELRAAKSPIAQNLLQKIEYHLKLDGKNVNDFMGSKVVDVEPKLSEIAIQNAVKNYKASQEQSQLQSELDLSKKEHKDINKPSNIMESLKKQLSKSNRGTSHSI